jgi:hypothetical protein
MILGVSLCGGALAQNSEKMHTWKDSSGTFEIKAAFVGEKDGVVTLRQEDGEELEIELEKLSTLDQNYVRTQKARMASPFKKKGAASPFRSKNSVGSKSKSKPEPASDEDAGSGDVQKTVRVNWTKAKLVQPASKNDWAAISIEPVDGSALTEAAQLPKKRDFFEKQTGFIAEPTLAIVGYKLEKPGGKDDVTTRLVSANLKTGDVGDVVVDGNYALLDVLGADGLMLMKQDVWGFGNQSQIEVWKAGDGGIDKQVGCVPFDGENGPAKDVKEAYFVDAGHVLVMNGQGKLGLVDLSNGKAAYLVECTNPSVARLSPDRKYLAVVTGKELHVLDALTGKALAGMPIATTAFPQLAFSPDGKRLCLQSNDTLWAWNLSDGSLYREMVLSGLPFNATIRPVWTSNQHVLVGSSILIDLENYVRLWQIDGAESATNVGGMTLFCIADQAHSGALVPVVLPHEGAVETLKSAMADRNFFVVQPGTSVRIDVSGIADAAAQQAAKEALQKKLTSSELVVADNASVILKASVENRGTEEQSYRSIGPGAGFGETKVTVTKWASAVALLVDGKPAWETAMIATPHFVNSEKNETIEQAIRRTNKPNYAFFESVGIPKYVMRPGNGGRTTLGASQITVNGLR